MLPLPILPPDVIVHMAGLGCGVTYRKLTNVLLEPDEDGSSSRVTRKNQAALETLLLKAARNEAQQKKNMDVLRKCLDLPGEHRGVPNGTMDFKVLVMAGTKGDNRKKN